MAGNTIGNIFRVTTFGESHGVSLGCIIDGMPAGFELNTEDIQIELDRRKPGTNKFVSPRQELDQIKILSGVFNGKTTGSSIGLLIKNKDKISSHYNNIKHVFRPGHADYTYFHKYGIRDYRGGGRSSARETCMRVAAGAIAKKFLKVKFNIIIKAFLSQIYNIKCFFSDWNCVDNNDFFCPNNDQLKDIQYLLHKVKCSGNSIGSKVTVYTNNVPIGLGEPVFDKIDADLAHALMSINAVKAVEIGQGISSITQLGSNYHDKLINNKFITNKCGGILGGISNGSPIITHIYIKPTPTIKKINGFNHYLNKSTNMKIIGRHDPCVGVRAVPISEAMTAIIIMDHILRYKAIKNI